MSGAPTSHPPPQADANPESGVDAGLIGELKDLIVGSLNLQDVPAQIDASTRLYSEGLGLDSIDILEVALLVSKRYGLHLRADDEDNAKIFRTLGSLAQYIATHRRK